MGCQSVFDLQEYKTGLSRHGLYRCASNDLWVDPFFSLTSGEPINETNLNHLIETSFSEPESYTGSTAILVDSTSFNPMEHKGR